LHQQILPEAQRGGPQQYLDLPKDHPTITIKTAWWAEPQMELCPSQRIKKIFSNTKDFLFTVMMSSVSKNAAFHA
jgi:hypothetical protein